MVNLMISKEAKKALEDLSAIRTLLERLVELEEKRAAQEQG